MRLKCHSCRITSETSRLAGVNPCCRCNARMAWYYQWKIWMKHGNVSETWHSTKQIHPSFIDSSPFHAHLYWKHNIWTRPQAFRLSDSPQHRSISSVVMASHHFCTRHHNKFNIIQPLRSPSDPFVLSFQRDPRRLALRGCYWGLWDLESPIKLITSGSFIFLAKWPIFSCHWVSQKFLLSDSIIVGIIIVSQSGTQQ